MSIFKVFDVVNFRREGKEPPNSYSLCYETKQQQTTGEKKL